MDLSTPTQSAEISRPSNTAFCRPTIVSDSSRFAGYALCLWLGTCGFAGACEDAPAAAKGVHASALTESAHGSYSDAYRSDWAELEDGRTGSRCPEPSDWPEPVTVRQAIAFDGDTPPLDPLPVLGDLIAPFVTVTDDEFRLEIPAHVAWSLNWDRSADEGKPDVPSRTLLIRNKRTVVIDGLAIRQLGHMTPEVRDGESLGYHGTRTAKSTIHIDGCEKAVLRNLCLQGPVAHSQIQITGCREVYIENVDIGGVTMRELFRDTDGDTREDADEFVLGGGISIHNGAHGSVGNLECKDGEVTGICREAFPCAADAESYVGFQSLGDVRSCSAAPWNSTSPYCELEWLVIENSYVHDYTYTPDSSNQNHDAIQLTSPACGVMFNNFIENWPSQRVAPTATAFGADAMLDVSHRRPCDVANYADHVFRIERNVFLAGEHGSLLKTTGVNGDATDGDVDSPGQSAVVFANNLFRNVNVVDYHARYPIYFFHGSAAFTSPTGADPALSRESSLRRHFHKQIGSCLPTGVNRFRNNMVRALTPWNHACSWHTFPVAEDKPDRLNEPRLMLYHTNGWFPGDYLAKLQTDFNEYWTYPDTEETVWFRNTSDYGCEVTEHITDWSGPEGWQDIGRDLRSESWDDCDRLYTDGALCHGRDLGLPIVAPEAAFSVPRDFFGLLRGSVTPDIGALESFSLGRVLGVSPAPITTRIAEELWCGLILGDLVADPPDDCPPDPNAVDANGNGVADCAECAGGSCDIASGKSYTLTPAPNYREDVGSGDGTDLTDDVRDRALITNETSVAWKLWPRVRIDVDLERPPCASDYRDCRPISEIRFHVYGGEPGSGRPLCPERAWFSVSDDGVTYYRVAEWERGATCLGSPGVTPGPDANPIEPTNFFVSSGPLETRGAFVRLEIDADDRYLSIDEVDVFAGLDPALTNYLDTTPDLGTSWAVVTGPAWTVLRADSFSASAPHATAIEIPALRGEERSFALKVTNPSLSSPLDLGVEVEDWVASAGARIASNTIDVRFAALAPTLAFEDRADALFPLSAGSTAPIPPRSVGHLLVTVRVPDSAIPGSYTSTMTVRCDGCAMTEWPIDLSLNVAAITLPRDGTRYFDWSYSIPESAPWIRGDYANDRFGVRSRFGGTSHVSYYAPPPRWIGDAIDVNFDESGFDANLERYTGWTPTIYLAGNSPRLRNLDGECYSEPTTELWKDRFEAWVGEIRDHMADLGYTTEDYVLHPVDEPGLKPPVFNPDDPCTGDFTTRDIFEEMAERIDAVDPSLQILVNLDVTHTLSDAVEVADLGYVDIWMPHLQSLGSTDLVDFYRMRREDHGEPTWAYNASLNSRISGSHVHPFRARVTPWFVHHFGLEGYGYWALYDVATREDSSDPISLWDPLVGDRPPWSTVYLAPEAGSGYEASVPDLGPDDERILPSRRLAAYHQGIVDIRKLNLLRSHLPGIPLRGPGDCTALIDEGWTIVNAAAASILASPDDAETFDTWMERLDDSIGALVPREVVGLEVASENATTVVSWADSGEDVLYDVAGGTIDELRQSGGAVDVPCILTESSSASWSDGRPDPAPGEGYYYLARASIDCATGDFGDAASPRSTECP